MPFSSAKQLFIFPLLWGMALHGQTPADDSTRAMSLKRMIPNVVDDQKKIWLFPMKVARGRDWIPAAAFLGTTAALIVADSRDTNYFRTTSSFHDFNRVFSGNATAVGTIVAPVSLYTAGLIRKDSKMQRTALFCGEAVADSEILAEVLKVSAKRLRPYATPPSSVTGDSFYDGRVSNGSFPSGHTIAAFSVATVVARQYGRQHKWYRLPRTDWPRRLAFGQPLCRAAVACYSP